MKDEITFGKYLERKRKYNQILARELAIKVGVSPAYICELEKDKRIAPKNDLLDKIAEVLNLNSEEKLFYYDLAANSQNTVSKDLPDYIMDKEIVRTALRTAKENDISDKEWQDFINRIEKSKGKR